MGTSKFYSIKNNSIVVGDHRVTGFGAETGAEYENSSSLFERTKSADGVNTTFSRLNDDDLMVTITVLETSYSYRRLGDLMREQLAAVDNGQAIPALSYNHRDRVTGDTVNCAEAVFMDRPLRNKTRTAGEREFTLALPNAGATGQFGALISP